MLQRLKRAWKLSKVSAEEQPSLAAKLEQEGDGKAEFLGEGSHEEYEEQEREKKGLKNVFGIGL